MALDFKKTQPRDIVYQNDLTIEWRDGVTSHFPFFALRDACPCAQCIDEMSGEKVLNPATIPADIHIKNAEYVGNYGLKVTWSDGHDTGIYHFKFLRELYDLAQEHGGLPQGPAAAS